MARRMADKPGSRCRRTRFFCLYAVHAVFDINVLSVFGNMQRAYFPMVMSFRNSLAIFMISGCRPDS